MKRLLFLALLMSMSSEAWAQKKPAKGLLPELKLEAGNEDSNAKKAVQSEVLISKSEEKAIAALNAVIKKKKGTPQEPDLWYRMAELYMRRAKSGRFFDLTRGQDDNPVRFAPPEVREETAVSNLKQAISIYNKIEKDFPKFAEMDSVLFNNAFASQQIGQKRNAEILYKRMIEKHPKSMMVPDAHLALGEMAYDAGTFNLALEHFRAIEKYPGARVYSYGLYKQGWTHYNLRQNQQGIDKLIEVVRYFGSENKNRPKVSHNLRSEALRDLALFFGETHSADQAYSFFAKICTPDELGEAMINMGKLYDSHSRQKEMNVFLADYLKKHPDSLHRIKAELLLIQGNETLKDRNKVIEHLESAHKVCRPGSAWRATHAATSEADCDYDLARVTMDMAKKWWEIWLKNKSNKNMADLTEKAFRIHLDRQDPAKPDAKSHYAYAELLFQQEKFRDASEQYETSARHSQDTQIAHDSAYASIVALEKAQAKSSKSGDSARLRLLGEDYLKKYPQGAQASQVRFKLGFIAYEDKNYAEAEKWLKPIAQDRKEDESLRTRSQDLMLDMLNARQDLNGIRDFSKSILAQAQNEDRKRNLQKIMQEADYKSIQKSLESEETSAAIQKLVTFHRENKDTSPLAKDSLWQAMGLAFSKGHSMEGAGLALEYARQYPQDDRSTDALRDAAKQYNEQGFLMKAAATLEILAPRVKPDEQAKIHEAVSEIYALEGRKSDARESLTRLLDGADKKTQAKIYARLLGTYKGEEQSADYQKLEGKILALGLEPVSSEIQLRRIEGLFETRKHTEAFNQAKGLVGGSAPAPVRAKARLIQARVLEQELFAQSVKTTIDRLPLVLSIKTERLEKAQQAYLAAAKISDDANVQLAVLEGLARCYKNYSDTVSQPLMKTQLKEDEKQALAEELAKLVAPIREKQKETEKKLISLAKSEKTATTEELDFANLPATETVKPRIPEIDYAKLPPYLPKLTQIEGLFVSRDQPSSKSPCPSGEKDLPAGVAGLMQAANACVSQKRFTAIEKIASRLAELEPKSGLAPYYLSLAAAGLGQNEKALYLAELALKKNDDKTFFLYQKALILGSNQDRAQANRLMIKAFDERLDAWETRLIHGVVAFSQGDCISVTEDFKAIPDPALDQFELVPALTECMAQKGEVAPAVALIQQRFNSLKTVSLGLQWGHLAEVYQMDSKAALQAYEKTRAASSRAPATLDWVKRKIDWLNNPNSVSDSDSLHVDSTVARKESLGGGR